MIETQCGNYKVCPSGRVWSKTVNRFLRPQKHRQGYLRVKINGKHTLVHRLVAKHYITKPRGKDIVNHIDGDPSNNSVFNLEWCTQKENVKHAFKTGLAKGRKGSENFFAVLDEATAKEIRCDLEKGIPVSKLVKKYGIKKSSIYNIRNRTTWKHV